MDAAGPCLTTSSRSASAPVPRAGAARPGSPPLPRPSGARRGGCGWRGRPSRADHVPDQRHTTIAREAVSSVTYWHVELDAHDILLADGLSAESYLDWGDRPFFTEGSDHVLPQSRRRAVVPGLAARCRPVAVDGPVSRPSASAGGRACSRRRSARLRLGRCRTLRLARRVGPARNARRRLLPAGPRVVSGGKTLRCLHQDRTHKSPKDQRPDDFPQRV